MGVQVNMPQGGQQTSMGRRLFAMGAPIAGMALGGPAGAAAGSLIGGKMMGQSTPQALAGAGESAFSRRMEVKKQDPAVGIQEGFNALPELEHKGLLKPDQRKYFTEALMRAKMTGGF